MARYERDAIANMHGYTWGEQPDEANTIKLNTNENPYPPTPMVDEALAHLSGDSLRRYPNPTADPLRALIADLHKVERDQIVVTHGGDEALRLAMTTFVDAQDTFVMADPSYSLYPVLADVQDATVVKIPLQTDWSLPIDFADQANAHNARLCCLVNPHAPSGTLLTKSQLADVAKGLNGVLLIDEAYIDFVAPETGWSSAELLAEHDNVLILRTFSKGYSLAGLRLGYLLGDVGLIDPIISKTRDSYNIDHISQQIGMAALADQDYARETWAKVRHERVRVQAQLGQLGLSAPDSHANFLLFTVPDNAALNARAIYEALKERDILVRFFDTPGLDDKLRISIGTETENNALIEALTDLLT